MNEEEDGEFEENDGTELCDCEFTLAYGTKILLHNAKMKLRKGKKYAPAPCSLPMATVLLSHVCCVPLRCPSLLRLLPTSTRCCFPSIQTF